MRRTIICTLMLFAVIAKGQMTTGSLRSKFGSPLSRETFVVRPGLQMVVDYAINGQVCRLQFPASSNIVGGAPPGIITHKMVDQALAEVVPPAMRGKEILHLIRSAGLLSFDDTEYEFVFVGEARKTNDPAQRDGVTVTFKGQTCQDAIAR